MSHKVKVGIGCIFILHNGNGLHLWPLPVGTQPSIGCILPDRNKVTLFLTHVKTQAKFYISLFLVVLYCVTYHLEAVSAAEKRRRRRML
mgnify:CR=1 FL=1